VQAIAQFAAPAAKLANEFDDDVDVVAGRALHKSTWPFLFVGKRSRKAMSMIQACPCKLLKH
jgi:hypothetical protein